MALSCLLAGPSAAAVASDLPDGVLARNRWVDLTKADYEQALARLPDEVRANVSNTPRRVELLLNRVLVDKTLAAQARARGLVTPAGEDGGERSLAAAEIRQIETDAAAAFDAKSADYESMAKEVYLSARERFREPPQARFADIAIAFKGRTEEEALERAKEARARVVAGEDFATVAREMSDDPVSREKGGELPLVSPKGLDRAYADSVFALTRVGEISEPIKASAAYHVVRLEELRPSYIKSFDEVRERIVQELRARYIAERREAHLRAIYADPELKVNQPAVDALVTHEDSKLFEPAPDAKAPPAAVPRSQPRKPGQPAGG